MKIEQWVIESCKGLGAFVLAFFVALNPIYLALLGFMLLDIATGILAAATIKAVDSQITFRGVTKKAIMLMIVVTAALLGTNADSVGLTVTIPLGEAVAVYYIINEALSVIENAARAGVPIPPILRDALKELGASKENETE